MDVLETDVRSAEARGQDRHRLLTALPSTLTEAERRERSRLRRSLNKAARPVPVIETHLDRLISRAYARPEPPLGETYVKDGCEVQDLLERGRKSGGKCFVGNIDATGKVNRDHWRDEALPSAAYMLAERRSLRRRGEDIPGEWRDYLRGLSPVALRSAIKQSWAERRKANDLQVSEGAGCDF